MISIHEGNLIFRLIKYWNLCKRQFSHVYIHACIYSVVHEVKHSLRLTTMKTAAIHSIEESPPAYRLIGLHSLNIASYGPTEPIDVFWREEMRFQFFLLQSNKNKAVVFSLSGDIIFKSSNRVTSGYLPTIYRCHRLNRANARRRGPKSKYGSILKESNAKGLLKRSCTVGSCTTLYGTIRIEKTLNGSQQGARSVGNS